MLDQVFEARDFRLESGQVPPRLRLAYKTCSKSLPDRSNVVLLTHGYNGSHHMAGPPGATLAKGLWNNLVDPGKAIDTGRFHVVWSAPRRLVVPPSLAPARWPGCARLASRPSMSRSTATRAMPPQGSVASDGHRNLRA